MSLTVLMVAEKPSIALTLAGALSEGGEGSVQKRRGVSPSSPVHEYAGTFRGSPARFKVTATTGHIYSLDFPQETNNWDKVSPGELFHAATVRTYDPRARIPEHIRSEAQDTDVLVLWLDCDREGENICFEVIGEAVPQMQPRRQFPDAYEGCIFRAQFSSLAAVDLREAMRTLGVPDICQAHSVDARQEIDLRLGVAFSRLQTLYFRKHFGNQLGKKMVTYGPCQFPTLWFCVKRHCEIEDFVPVPFWNLQLTISVDGQHFLCRRAAGEFWNEDEASQILASVRAAGPQCKIQSVRPFRSRIARPLPLNTVSLLRMASDELGLGPGDALHFAEQLYLKGITSYPRTETDKYPANFDLQGTARTLSNPNAAWAHHAQQILEGTFTEPRQDGFDAGDHPPITPVKFTASASQCGGEAGYALYCAICTHFLSSISPDALLDEAEMSVDLGGEVFVASSRRCVQRGWLDVDNRNAPDRGPVDLRTFVGRQGQELPVLGADSVRDETKPPNHLTESELLGFMEQHQIGTDASMATHVSNVQKRAYVELDESTRQMVPSPLGLALAHAYALIDQGLILPSVRARIENECASVARGAATKEAVVERNIRNFERRFHNFAMRIDRLPMMLAVAHAQERGSGLVAGDAVGEGLAMWQEARALHRRITLEALLEERDRIELEEVQGDIPLPGEASRLVEERTPAVQRVQQALEQLGFGSADAPKEPSRKAKAKAKASDDSRSQGSAINVQRHDDNTPAPVNAGTASLASRLESVLLQSGGSLSLNRLSTLLPGTKKADILKLGAFHVTPEGIVQMGGGQAGGDGQRHSGGKGGKDGKGSKDGNGGKGGKGGKGAASGVAASSVQMAGGYQVVAGPWPEDSCRGQGSQPDVAAYAQQALQQQLFLMQQHGRQQQHQAPQGWQQQCYNQQHPQRYWG